MGHWLLASILTGIPAGSIQLIPSGIRTDGGAGDRARQGWTGRRCGPRHPPPITGQSGVARTGWTGCVTHVTENSWPRPERGGGGLGTVYVRSHRGGLYNRRERHATGTGMGARGNWLEHCGRLHSRVPLRVLPRTGRGLPRVRREPSPDERDGLEKRWSRPRAPMARGRDCSNCKARKGQRNT